MGTQTLIRSIVQEKKGKGSMETIFDNANEEAKKQDIKNGKKQK